MPDIHNTELKLTPIPDSTFGNILGLANPAKPAPVEALVSILEAQPELLLHTLDISGGLLLLQGMHDISDQPDLLLRLSQLCGEEVEDYRHTLTLKNFIHPDVPEILVLGNKPPSNRKPPPRPEPPLTDTGELPVQFPHRRGWHTDQSFRRPPPDLSLFYCVTPCLKGQGQTLYGDGTAAYAALADEMKRQIDSLEGLHALLHTGRSEKAMRQGDEIKALEPHQQSQRQPVVRKHPRTGVPALYLCEDEQMDWLDGPIVGMETGPDGEGGRLLYKIMSHYTQAKFVYAHDWDAGDLVIYDNRCLIHSATWYDDSAADRLMWRTTVRGDPGPEYHGEARSWLPANSCA